MNRNLTNARRRQEPARRSSRFVIFSLILALVIGATGGVMNVVFKNSQIKTAREIDAIEKRIDRHKLAARTITMRSDQILNLYTIRTQLKDAKTTLVPIPPGVTEDILPTQPSAVASIEPTL